MECRICYGSDGTFVRPCLCKGQINVHDKCLRKWIEASHRDTCEICGAPYSQKEVFSCQITNYLRGCVCVPLENIYFPWLILTMCISFVSLLLTSVEGFLLLSSISVSCMYVIFYICTLENPKIITLDALLWWKVSYSIPLAIMLYTRYLEEWNDCATSCYVYLTGCNVQCPFFLKIAKNNHIILKNALFDLSNIIVILFVRGIAIFKEYNKKIVFEDFEVESLLTNGNDHDCHNC